MNTNGGIGTINWWNNLGTMLNRPDDYVIFSIDGLQDTNHLYRRNVVWDKVMDNARAFINAGGRAHWEMLLFKHNEHQIDEAKELAQNLGFKFFNTKVSRRFKHYPVAGISPPSVYLEQEPGTKIECHAIKENSVYVSAKGILHPCCWLGYRDSKHLDEFEQIKKTWDTADPYHTCLTSCSVSGNISHFANQWKSRIKIF
jgi:MoaA/NifB/PqqE/SkfB family radical SAM enzyme